MLIARYLTKEVYTTLVATTLVLLFIFISNQFIHFLYSAAAGKISAHLIALLLLLKTPVLLGTLLPLSLFLAILLSYGRMHADNEMVVMFTSGVSHSKILKITMAFALLITLIIAALMLWISPPINKYTENLLSKGALSPLELVSAGHFQSMQNSKWLFYIGGISSDHTKLHDVFAAEIPNRVLTAQSGQQQRDPKTGNLFLVLQNGHRYIGTPGAKDYQIVKFDQYWLRIDHGFGRDRFTEFSQSTATLLHSNSNGAAAELQWRLSMPIMALILALMAVPLAQVKTRQKRYAQLIPAIFLYIIYANFMFLCRSWLHDGKISHALGVWWLHGTMLLSALLLNLQQMNWQKLINKFKS